MFPPFLKVVPIAKVVEGPNGLATAWGIATEEKIDKDREICDYTDTKPGYQAWSEEILKATTAAGQEPSLGNVRIMHTLEPGGKVTKLEFMDDARQVWIGSEAADEAVSDKLRRGIFTGYSQGGSYIWRRCDTCASPMPQGHFCERCQKNVIVRYAARPSEVSFVDNPCLGSAHFVHVKADGSTEVMKFAAASEALTKYSDDQPRDEGGRFAEADSPAATRRELREQTKQAHRQSAEAYHRNTREDHESAATVHEAAARARLHFANRESASNNGSPRELNDRAVAASHESQARAHRQLAALLPKLDADELNKASKGGIQFVIGFPKEGKGSEVQSILFDKEKWTKAEAIEWLKDNKFGGLEVDETEGSLRFRQTDPDKYKRLRTITPGESKEKAMDPREMLKLVNDAVEEMVAKLRNASGAIKSRALLYLKLAKSVQLDASESIDAQSSKIRRALIAKYGSDWGDNNNVWVTAVFADKVVYSVGSQLFACTYSMKDDVVTLGDDAVKVHIAYVEDTEKAAESSLRKDMGHISLLSSILDAISNLKRRVAQEGEYEEDTRDAEIASQLNAWIEAGIPILTALVDEETSELLDDDEEPANVLTLAAKSCQASVEGKVSEPLLAAAKAVLE